VFAEEEAELLASAAADPATLASMVERRVAGEPLEAIVGWASFCGLRIVVAPGVFVPRRRTELLVAEADESDGSFLRLTPEIAIVSTISLRIEMPPYSAAPGL